MGWYSVYKLLEQYGSWDSVPLNIRIATLKSEVDPSRTVMVAQKKYGEDKQ